MKDVNMFGDRDAPELDALLRELSSTESLALHLSGAIQTEGVYRWGEYASRNLGKDWTVDGDAEISLVKPAQLDNQPLFVLAGPAKSVTGITVCGNHSVLSKDWPGSLRTGGILLYGDSHIDGVKFQDFGATRAPDQPKSVSSETFVAEIIGSGSITNSTYHDSGISDDQVTVFRIMGSENGEVITDKPCLMQGNKTYASGVNQVQAHTIYWSTNGLVRTNTTRGVKVSYYGDWAVTKGIEITGNDFEATDHGVQLQLSPGYDFSHENYTIGPNRMVTGGANVSINTNGHPTATRFIRGIKVDAGLSLENLGGEVVRTNKKGCNPFAFLRRQ